ncbi:MAG: type II toxin-antitoxin system mRNA interferase toxin, RelE/StbE family, partial [Chloroflexi bacterium]|nr:type II toxin-antitoxin system mRNA interferase toxin, RelE/StbE family [Chloroflexota bacterium]
TKLPATIRKKVDKALHLLGNAPGHPSLRTKKIQGVRGIYEARINRNYRMTYERLGDDVIRLRVVGEHDEALKNP